MSVVLHGGVLYLAVLEEAAISDFSRGRIGRICTSRGFWSLQFFPCLRQSALSFIQLSVLTGGAGGKWVVARQWAPALPCTSRSPVPSQPHMDYFLEPAHCRREFGVAQFIEMGWV